MEMAVTFAPDIASAPKSHLISGLESVWHKTMNDLQRECGEDVHFFFRQMDHIILRRLPVGLAAIVGEVPQSLCHQLRTSLGGICDFITWVNVGPMHLVAFSADLFHELQPLWQKASVRVPHLRAGLAFSEGSHNAEALFAHARSALLCAIDQQMSLHISPQAAIGSICA